MGEYSNKNVFRTILGTENFMEAWDTTYYSKYGVKMYVYQLEVHNGSFSGILVLRHDKAGMILSIKRLVILFNKYKKSIIYLYM